MEGTSFGFTLGSGVSSAVGDIVAFSGVNATGGFKQDGTTGGPFDVDPGTISVSSNSTAAVTAAAIVTSSANAAVVMFGMAANTAPTWVDASWSTASAGQLTELLDHQGGAASVGAAWLTKSSAGPTGAGAATLSGNQRNGGILLALRPAAFVPQWSGAIATFRAASTSTLALTGPSANNYTLGGATGSVVITPKSLAVTGLGASNREYDGTTAVALTGTAGLQTAAAAGTGTTGDGKPYTGDALTLGGTATGAFADKHAANNKPVTVSGITLGGAQADNYTLTQPAGLTADVTPLPITLSAVSATKTYDGTTSAPGTPTLTPALASGDSASILAQAFQNPNAGSGNKVILPNITINDGNNGANYAVTPVNFNSGTISPAPATITLGGLAHTYDGTSKVATATTNPPGKTVDITYNGLATAPVEAGSYAVIATVNDVNYVGTASGTMIISGADAMDAWRTSHFIPEEITAGLAADGTDADGDGFTNLAEYTLGTDPRDFTPQPLALAPAPGNLFTLSFIARSAAGAGYAGLTRQYDVEATTDLANPNSWQGLSGHTHITGAGQTIDITLPSDGPRMFYRLNVRVE